MIQVPAGVMLTSMDDEGHEEHFPAIIRLHVVIVRRDGQETVNTMCCLN